jgi:hypothetical protein
MEVTKLNHAHPSKMEARHIEEIRKMTAQQRFEKLMAIIEISYLLKTVNRPKDILDIEELEKINKKSDS